MIEMFSMALWVLFSIPLFLIIINFVPHPYFYSCLFSPWPSLIFTHKKKQYICPKMYQVLEDWLGTEYYISRDVG